MRTLSRFAAFLVLAASFAAAARADDPNRYFRAQESEDGGVFTMQLAIRSFQREGDDRTVSLAAAVHIGDRAFYKTLQSRLDAMDLVLFEGVRPPGSGRAEFDLNAGTDEARAAATTRRIRFLAVAANMHKEKQGDFPASIDELRELASDRMAEFVESNVTDAWGRPLNYTRLDGAIEIESLGADGAAGGEGVNADLKFSAQEPLKKSEVPKRGGSGGRGLQQQMASALGLVFQLDEMDHSGEKWRSSDLSVDQIQERMAAAGANADDLFKMLEGSGFQAGIAKLVLGLMKMMPTAQTYGKIAIMEAMTRADDLIELAPGSMAGAMDVIIHDRNAVVIADLKQVLEREPGLKRIGIIYGGGHMDDLEKSLTEMGFVERGVEWNDAMSVNASAAGLKASDVKQVRTMIARSLDQQVKAAKRAKERREKKAKASEEAK